MLARVQHPPLAWAPYINFRLPWGHPVNSFALKDSPNEDISFWLTFHKMSEIWKRKGFGMKFQKKKNFMCFTPQNQKTSGVAKTSQGSKIKAKSIEMAPVIGKVLHQPVARVELINPWGWFCFRTSHPHEGYYDLQTRVVFGRHATPKKKKLFYLLKFLPNLRSSWIFVESKLHPKLSKKPPSYWFLHPLPHLHVSSLPSPTLDVFKPLSHRGWTIINQCTTIQQKLPTSRGGSRSGPPSTVVLAQFWLVSLVVETILGISPSSCLYGKGIPLVDFAGLPGRHFFSNRWNYEKVVGAQTFVSSGVFQVHGPVSLSKRSLTNTLFSTKKTYPPEV